ncbi:AraC family transcriptional regulator [Chryseobacterium daeguense]|uniref:AraC family transcriptional regulator n=1 Tax=Chryseobacterium daeguense TaxID=412438 RepID=UPI000415B38A|nr:AraC family transcriptional regulator [Chryseobacterium daeguense]
MREKIYCFIFFVCCLFIKAQNSRAYDSIYTKTYLETSQKDMNAALKIADSLFNVSETPHFQTKSLMLSASLYQQAGDLKKSVSYAEKSAAIISETDNTVWKARVYGFLATQYRLLKFYILSKKYIHKTLEESKKIENPEAANSINGLMYQELAYYHNELKNYKKSISSIHKAQFYFNLTKKDKIFFTTNNEQLLGLNYLGLKNTDQSLIHYNKALELNKTLPESFLTGLIYSGLSNVFMDKSDLGKAKEYLDLAEKVAKNSGYLELKREVYATSEKYYSKTKEFAKVAEVSEKKDSVEVQLYNKSAQFLDTSYSKIDGEITKSKESNNQKMIIIFVGIILLIAGSIYFYFYKKRQKTNIERYKKIVNNYKSLKSKSAVITPTETVTKTESDLKPEKEKNVVMTDLTEKLLLSKLQEFEESTLFTDKNISLSYLAAHFNTNTRYLSHVINKYKEKDFNNYINSLRIKFIVNKLADDPMYVKYKIATLAEESGFSSPNKFTMIFKKITDVSPSEYIRDLREKVQ